RRGSRYRSSHRRGRRGRGCADRSGAWWHHSEGSIVDGVGTGVAGRGCGPATPVEGSLTDSEALLTAVFDDGVLPGDETVVQVGLVRPRLPCGVTEDAVGVHLEGEVGPAGDDLAGCGAEHLVDLLTAEVLRLVVQELVVGQLGVRGREAALIGEDLQALRAVVQPFQETGGQRRVLALLGHRLTAATVLRGRGRAVPGRDGRDAPVAGGVRHGALEDAGHPCPDDQRGDAAVCQALVPVVGPAGCRRNEIVLNQLVPVVRPPLGAFILQVDGDVGTVDAERLATSLPDRSHREAGVTG